MNPLPLTAPDGRVYAYACGVCHQVSGGVSKLVRLDGPDESLVEGSCVGATSCCACLRCGALLSEERYGTCLACKPAEERERAELCARLDANDKRVAAVVTASLVEAENEDAAMRLLGVMRDLSEEHWCAQWLMGLEFSLWEIAQGGSRDFGMGEVSDIDVAALRELHERAGGWWRWVDGTGEVFVATAAWERMHAGADARGTHRASARLNSTRSDVR